MVVTAGIFGWVMVRPVDWPPCRFPRMPVEVELRHDFAAPLMIELS